MADQESPETRPAAASAEPFGVIYSRFMLDPVVELAGAVAAAVTEQPESFGDLSPQVLKTLQELRDRTGDDPGWPDATQRGVTFDIYLGNAFTAASAAVRLAALRFDENSSGPARQARQEAIIDSATTLRSLLEPVGEQAGRAARGLAHMLDRSVEVFADPSLRRAFGMTAEVDPGWPLATAASPNEANLLDRVRQRVSPGGACATWDRYYFLTLQRVAVTGQPAIEAIFGVDPQAPRSVEKAAVTTYRWTTALNDLLPAQQVVRAWKSPAVRTELTDVQRRHLPPHPAGDIEGDVAAPDVGPQAAGQTFTVSGEICCSTTPSVSCMSHCPPPDGDIDDIVAPSTYPCCTHHC